MNLVNSIFIMGCLALSPIAGNAGELFGTVNLASKHIPYDSENEFNPGIGIGYRFDDNWAAEVGFYENSYSDQTVYGLGVYEQELGDSDFFVGAFAGIGSGYYELDSSIEGVTPLAGVQARYKFLQVRAAPQTDGVVFGFQLIFNSIDFEPEEPFRR